MRVFLLILLVFTLSLFSANTALLDGSKETGYKIQFDTDSYLDINFNVKDINFEDILTEKGVFASITIDNGYTTRVEGSPALPTFHELIAMPYGAEPEVEVISYDSKIYKLSELGIDHLIMPAQPSYSKSSNPEDRKFIYNATAYTSSKFTDQEIVSISKSGTMRGIGVGALKVRPFKYNSADGTIEVLNNLQIRINYVNSNFRAEEIKAESYSPYFESSLQTLINYQPSNIKSDLMNWPVTYLIVASDALSGNSDLQRFVDWKTEKGFKVIVNYVSSTSSIFTNDAWVENQWNTLSPKPSFVLLIGDESGTYNVEAQDNPSLGSGGSVTRSDLEYGVIGTTGSSNRIPSMYVGRFSVRLTSELTAQVDKTIWYEKEQFTTGADLTYLTYPLGVAGVDASFSASHGDPHISYGWTHYFTSANGMSNADYYLSDTSNYSSTAGNVVSYISNGANFYNYTAHGEQTAFQSPLFSISNIDGLGNSGEYPLVIGNCCLTGSFGTTECFGEAWLNAPNKGAIGYIGASMSTYWDEDLAMGVGIGDTSVQGDVPPTLNISDPGMYDGVMELGYSSQASIKHIGLMAVENYGGTKVDWYWSSYHMFGDPSLQPYFGIPAVQSASHSGSIDSAESSFAVTTTPYAYIALTDQSNVLHGAAQANSSGYASVSIDPYSNGDTAKIVVTAQFKKPYFEDITVGGGSTPPSTPVLASPTSSSSTTDRTPTFDWSDVSGATTYTLQVDNNSGFTSPEISQTTTSSSYTPSSDLSLGTYYWRVKANNTYGSSSYASYWSVAVENAIVYTLPFSQNFNASTSLPSDWSIVDIEGNGQIWQFGIHTSGMTGADGNYAYLNSDSYGSGNSQNTDLITPLIDMSGQANVNLSFNHYFRYYSPSTATLSYSINGGNSWTQIQSWTSTDTANPLAFDQEISAVAGQSLVKFKWNYTGTYGYYWDIDDISITAQASSPPAIPVLATPANGSSTTDRTPSFDWSDVSTATSYNLQVDNNSDFTSPEISKSVSSSNYIPASNLALDTYYWRVNASNTNGTSSYTAYRSIIIEAVPSYTLPFTEDFNASTSLPDGWTQQNSSGVTDRWSVSVSTNASGTVNEMKCSYQQIDPGTTRLVTPLIDTDGYSTLDLSFKYLLDDYDAGATLLIQSSSDGINWTNESWSLATASNDMVGPGIINTTVTSNVGTGTYIAFVATGNLYQFDYWYVDDISITSEAPVYPPSATTLSAGSVTTGSATLNASVNANSESTAVTFEYGLTTGYGHTVNSIPSSVTGISNTSVYANISGLTDSATYNYRVKAVSTGGTVYGSNLTFTTDLSVSTVDSPTNLTALASGSNVSLTWTAPIVSGPDPDTLTDGFETYSNFALDFSPWTQIDGDGSSTFGSNEAAFENENYTGAYIIFNPSAATPALAGNWGAHSGSKYATCFGASTPPNDDWLISPQLLIGSGYNLDFYAKSVTDQYGLERFKVAVSTTGTNTGDFTIISSGSYVEAPTTWTNYNYDLSAYDGQEVYIALICVSNDAFVFMLDDISVDNAKGEIVFAQGFEKGREVLRTPVSKVSYSGNDSPQADFSPATTRDMKSNLTGFKVYRNSNLLATIYNPLDLTYFDAGLTDGSYSYNVTATYSGPVQESDPSTTKFVTISNEYVIDSFPWNESFEKLTFAPDEWEVQSASANTWAETTGYVIGETTVSPVDGSKFAYVNWIAEDQDEWLVTPPIDISFIDSPELSFWFNGSYYYSVDPEPNAMLKVMQKVDDGSWTEIWKASDHTGFDADYVNYSWLETTLPIGLEGIVQFAFVYAGNDGANFAIDDVTVNGIPKELKNSVVDTGNGLEMHLSWNYVAGATSYHIYRSADAYNNFERIGTTTSNYFVDDTVGDSKMFFYYLTADSAKK